jgi:hypothetical protein
VGLVGDKGMIIVEFFSPIAAGKGREGSNPAAEKKRAYSGKDRGLGRAY